VTYASVNNQRACSACPLVSLSKTKPCQFSSVTSLCTRLCGTNQGQWTVIVRR